jgi:hypothetical protein
MLGESALVKVISFSP